MIRNNLSHIKETQLQETLKAMENELRSQQKKYEEQLAEARRDAELARLGTTGMTGKTASELILMKETLVRENAKEDGDRKAAPVTPQRPAGTPKRSSTVRRRNSTISRHNRLVNRHMSPRSHRKSKCTFIFQPIMKICFTFRKILTMPLIVLA